MLTMLLAGSITLMVHVTGVRNDKGFVRCAAFATADGFPSKPDSAVTKSQATPASGEARIELTGVPADGVAVSCIHDENANGILDKNFLGIPKEGYGFSNGAKGKVGPPPFDAARFVPAGDSSEITVKLSY